MSLANFQQIKVREVITQEYFISWFIITKEINRRGKIKSIFTGLKYMGTVIYLQKICGLDFQRILQTRHI